MLVFEYRRYDLNFETRTYNIKPNTFWQHLASRENAPIVGKDPNTGLATYDKQTGKKTDWTVKGAFNASAAGGVPGGGGKTVARRADLGKRAAGAMLAGPTAATATTAGCSCSAGDVAQGCASR